MNNAMKFNSIFLLMISVSLFGAVEDEITLENATKVMKVVKSAIDYKDISKNLLPMMTLMDIRPVFQKWTLRNMYISSTIRIKSYMKLLIFHCPIDIAAI